MRGRAITTIAGLCAAVLLFSAAGLRAEPPRTPPEGPGVIGYTAQELRAFVAATIVLGRIQENHRNRTKGSRTAEEAEKFLRMADAETLRAVTKEGLTLDRYNAMAEAVTTDPLMAEQLNRFLHGNPDGTPARGKAAPSCAPEESAAREAMFRPRDGRCWES